MQKLILILILIFGFELHSQTSDYIALSESDIKVKFQKNIDTLNNKRFSWKWKVMKSEDKEKIRNLILEMKKDIESDTSDLTNIYYYGKKENVDLKINGKLLKPTSSIAEYDSESIYGGSIYKINLGTIPRFSKVESVELLLNDSKRTAKFDINTKYSLINIKVENIESASEIIKRKKEFYEYSKKEKKSNELPEPPDTIEVEEDREFIVYHKIPKRKHSW